MSSVRRLHWILGATGLVLLAAVTFLDWEPGAHIWDEPRTKEAKLLALLAPAVLAVWLARTERPRQRVYQVIIVLSAIMLARTLYEYVGGLRDYQRGIALGFHLVVPLALIQLVVASLALKAEARATGTAGASGGSRALAGLAVAGALVWSIVGIISVGVGVATLVWGASNDAHIRCLDHRLGDSSLLASFACAVER